MPIADQLKNLTRKLVEAQPSSAELGERLRRRKPLQRRFDDDGLVPNHPHWPLVIYRSALAGEAGDDLAAALDALFAENDWGRSWRAGIYDFVHYHSQTHEVLGVARGKAHVEFGGPRGRIYQLAPGDVAVLPAGTGHRLVDGSEDFLVVGAYPPEGAYDEVTDSRQRPDAIRKIRDVPAPLTDPVYGAEGPLLKAWR